jgi:hypothetical protein
VALCKFRVNRLVLRHCYQKNPHSELMYDPFPDAKLVRTIPETQDCQDHWVDARKMIVEHWQPILVRYEGPCTITLRERKKIRRKRSWNKSVFFMVCILLCTYLYNIYLLISQSTQQFLQWQNKHYCVNICLLCVCGVVPLAFYWVTSRSVRLKHDIRKQLQHTVAP